MPASIATPSASQCGLGGAGQFRPRVDTSDATAVGQATAFNDDSSCADCVDRSSADAVPNSVEIDEANCGLDDTTRCASEGHRSFESSVANVAETNARIL